MPAVGTDALLGRYEAIKDIREKVMTQDVDYGVIPGTDKPTLLKPGAEKLCTAFALYPEFEPLDEAKDWDAPEPFFFFRYRCTLHSRDGRYTVGSGIGSCNSRETKYRYRWSKPTCPDCGKELRKSKRDPEYYCWTKLDGCGATFPLDDKRIEPAQRIPNPDIADQVNTIDKMAQKRALVAATLVAVGASEFFTQDIEDLPDFGGMRETAPTPPQPAQEPRSGANGDNPPNEPAAPQGKPKVTIHNAPKAATGKPYYDEPRPHKPEVVREYFAHAEKNDTKDNPREPLDNETRQTIFLKVAGLFPNELARRVFQLWAFGVSSITEMTNGQGRAYWVWADKPAMAKRELDDIMASESWATVDAGRAAKDAIARDDAAMTA